MEHLSRIQQLLVGENGRGPEVGELREARKCLSREIRRREADMAVTGPEPAPEPPFGWVYDPADRNVLLPQPQEQEVVQVITALRGHGLTYFEICRELESLDLAYRGHRRWHKSKVRSILRRAGIG